MPRTIAIIGGGFSGTALAVQLLSRAKDPLDVVLINRSGLVARGLAYGTHSSAHVLNVPAARMSLFPDADSDFFDYAQSFNSATKPGDFVSRGIYGHYLEQRLLEAAANAPTGVNYRHLSGHVVDIEYVVGGVRLHIDDGSILRVQQAVLATGNFAPGIPKPFLPVHDHPAFVADPWRVGALVGTKADDAILLIGTGLTMFDMALSLEAQGHRGMLTAISRRGLRPAAHREGHDEPPVLPVLPSSLLEAKTTRGLMRELRIAIAEYSKNGRDWRDVIVALRSLTPSLWRGLPIHERKRFLRHAAPYWEIHRHRAAPAIADRIDSLIKANRLWLMAGRILEVSSVGDGLRVTSTMRGHANTQSGLFSRVINCTGPQSDVHDLAEPLFKGLLAKGYIQPDALALGLRADDHYALLDATGSASDRLFLMSPMLKAEYWEATAVPELREHAERLASHLLTLEADEDDSNVGVTAGTQVSRKPRDILSVETRPQSTRRDVGSARRSSPILFRQLFDSASSSYTYLIAAGPGKEAVLIDPVRGQVPVYQRLIEELKLKLVVALDTHTHADHITGLGLLRDALECKTLMGEGTKADCVSQTFREGEVIRVGDLCLHALYTPGHTDDSYSLAMEDRVFTGDTLLIRGTGRTDFQNGDPYAAYDSLFNKLLRLPDETLVYPAHDYKGSTVSTIGEEQRFNPRLQIKNAEQYATVMNGLNLPKPELMDVAIPANRMCGHISTS